jgi:hypothetical protein
MNMHKFWAYPSSYVGMTVWGAAGFMAQPTFASFIVHFTVLPVLLFGALWLAHREGLRLVGGTRR